MHNRDMVSNFINLIKVIVIYLQGKKMPGELFSLAMEMINELNQSVSGFMQLEVKNVTKQVSI